MNFLDTTVLVFALLEKHSEHPKCIELLNARDSLTDSHCLAEAFAALTAAYKLRNTDAAALLLDRPLTIAAPVLADDYRVCLEKPAVIQGGGIYDAIHAAVARRLKVKALYTYNISNFLHHAPDLNVSRP
jgi:predicted nucleic acid-binding protein